MVLATWIVRAVLAYALIGVVFALAFVLRGARKIDPDALEGSWGFRVLIFPGSVALWPVLARLWLRSGEAREEKSPHRALARERGAP